MPISHMLLIFFTGSLFGFFITSCAWYWSNKKIARAAKSMRFYDHVKEYQRNRSSNLTEPHA